MENNIPAIEFCAFHRIEVSFLHSLADAGLVEMASLPENGSIPADQLDAMEKYIRLYNDLEINIPGIEAVAHLLDKIQSMQQEILRLRNRLGLYEGVQ